MIVTTTMTVDGKPIREYLGVASGEAILGANVLKDISSSIRDLVGGRSGSYEQVIYKARKIAMEHHWPARVDDVVAVRIPDVPGSLANILAPLRGKRIDVDYMYAFTGFSSGEAVMIFRFRNQKGAKELLQESGVVLLGAKEFGLLEGDDG